MTQRCAGVPNCHRPVAWIASYYDDDGTRHEVPLCKDHAHGLMRVMVADHETVSYTRVTR